MSGNVNFYCGLLLLLLFQVHARPSSDEGFQALSRLLEGEFGRYSTSEDLTNEAPPAASRSDLNADQSREIASLPNLARILQDLSTSPLRFRRRSRKGRSRGCFGVKLDRIGSMSGLGC
ncbi:C-type natriuretic peptide prohormone-like [Amblyraja radiata]|uniref:C-type natriuretic peptide prohormone-like n=1 Tax=Amblyraja radiata TaxID=386614 RepID=UPI00140356E6|nr:C-type natriuretic peptide prohormone-like [Amblyraja radiata]